MKNISIKYLLIGLWLLGFLVCVSIVIAYYKYVPPKFFDDLLNQVFFVFTPPLATMLAFIFSDQATKKVKKQGNAYVSVLSVVLSAAYVGGVCIILVLWSQRILEGVQVTDMIGKVYPKTSFLISGMITYYFASRK